MTKGLKRYKSIFTLATLQFDGHVTEYFRENTETLVALYLLPRGGSTKNFVEYYEKGTLIERREFYSPKHLIPAYICYYLEFLYILIRYFPPRKNFYFINFQPIFFFFRPIIRLFWGIEYVYWVGDYWPMNVLSIRIFRFLMHYFHDRTPYTLYLSDRINKAMNYGRIIERPGKSTIMWGTKPPRLYKKIRPTNADTLCFIGVLAQWQGIDALLSVVAQNPRMRLKLIGTGKPSLMATYKKQIAKYAIADRVFFPNKFYYGLELKKIINDCDIGIALYDVNPNSVSYYADPAKIKQYAEFGLPIIMTDAADIARYVAKFNAGIIVERDHVEIAHAVKKIKDQYPLFQNGVKKFNDFFHYREYYSRKLSFLEKQ